MSNNEDTGDTNEKNSAEDKHAVDDIPVLLDRYDETRDRLRARFGATRATVNNHGDESTIRLVFENFAGVDGAAEKARSVAHALRAAPDVDGVSLGVTTDPHDYDGVEAWVRATTGGEDGE